MTTRTPFGCVPIGPDGKVWWSFFAAPDATCPPGCTLLPLYKDEPQFTQEPEPEIRMMFPCSHCDWGPCDDRCEAAPAIRRDSLAGAVQIASRPPRSLSAVEPAK